MILACALWHDYIAVSCNPICVVIIHAVSYTRFHTTRAETRTRGMAFDRKTFDAHVLAGNADYRKLTSSLKGLMNQLDKWPNQTTDSQIVEEMAKVPTDKQQNRYSAAFDYLRKNFPGGVIPEAVLPGPGQAVPVDFKTKLHEYKSKEQYATVYDGMGASPELAKGLTKHHAIFACTWKSSSGNLGDLGNASRELCTYRTPPNQPPFNSVYDAFVRDHPLLQYAQPARSLSNKMTLGSNHDDHSVNDPNMLCCNPRQVGRLVMDQVYQYNVTPPPSDANWIDIPHTRFLIIKEVLQSAGGWTFRWTKKQAVGNQEKLLYGYDVRLGAVPAKFPRKITDLTL